MKFSIYTCSLAVRATSVKALPAIIFFAFFGQPSKSEFCHSSSKNMSSRCVCTSLIMVCSCLFYFFCAFIDYSLEFLCPVFQVYQLSCDIIFGYLSCVGRPLKLPVHVYLSVFECVFYSLWLPVMLPKSGEPKDVCL